MQALAHEVACYLGMDLGGIKIKRFADGEIYVQVQVRRLHISSEPLPLACRSQTCQVTYSTPFIPHMPGMLPPGLDLLHAILDRSVLCCMQESIRGCDVFLVQPSCPPVNDHLMELLVMIDACKRASARSITAVIPYYGYARADRKTQGRESIAAKLTANLITEAGMAAFLHSARVPCLVHAKFVTPCGRLFSAFEHSAFS